VCPSLDVLEAHPRQRSDRAHKSRRPSRSPRESPRAQLQKELPSRYKYKQLQHPHTAMHVKGTDKQADHRVSTPGIIQAVRSNSDLPVRAWGAASTCSAFPLFRCLALSGLCVDSIRPGFSLSAPLSFLFPNPSLVASPPCSFGYLPSAHVSWQSRCDCSNRPGHHALPIQSESVAPQCFFLCRSLENEVEIL